MSIVKMSKLRIIAPQNIRRPLLRELTRLGCVEIGNSVQHLIDPQWSAVLQKLNEPTDAAKLLASLHSALDTLHKYAPSKSSFLTPRRQISESTFNDKKCVGEASDAAEQLNGYTRQITSLYSEEGRLTTKKASLLPWANLDVPFGVEFGQQVKIIFGVCPAPVVAPDLILEAETAGDCLLALISSDREQHYFLLISHKDSLDATLDLLKAKGFSGVAFKDIQGTAAANIQALDKRLGEIGQQRQGLISKVGELSSKRALLEQASDLLTIESRRDDVLNGLVGTAKTVYLEGWTPLEATKSVTGVLEKHGCAYEFSDPEETDEPPVLLQNNNIIRPYGMVSELYALPTYASGLDPNPFMAPFFFVFFGLMMADVGYGIIISLASLFILKKGRPQGAIGDLARLGVQCGISTIFWGVMFGSYFGNVISAFTGAMLGHEIVIPPVLFDPLTNPMPLFILSLAFGVIQIFLGMGLNGYCMIKKGNIKGAIFDVGFWYLLLGGFLICYLNLKLGLTLAALGALGILLTAGRDNKPFLKKITGGLGALYGVTSYLSDVLSYSRLLALSLATAVIAQVMNTMGTLGGNTVLGWILFICLFIVGHLFNLAINLLGTFVHTSRLQYIEFFGKFFEAGGRKFAPLYNKTKYVEVVKEGN